MKIALCHFRVGETDGVSLEMDKWKKALENLGHDVVYIAGSDPNGEAILIPELHYQHPLNHTIIQQAYQKPQEIWPEDKLRSQVFMMADLIESALLQIIKEHQIDVLVPNNILSLGWGLAAGVAFTKAIQNSCIQAVCHHHDFHWERELYAHPNFKFVQELLKEYFPPSHQRINHICINHIAKEELYSRCSIDATVIPNVFDFEDVLILNDDFNSGMRAAFGIAENDIVVLQATRIVERKAVEIAIDFVAELQTRYEQKMNLNTSFHLIFAGQSESEAYYNKLLALAQKKKVHILDISAQVAHQRSSDSASKVYSLWDTYSIANLVTYPSILEGWGNQFLEAVVARLPIACYEYPVYKSDIAKYQFSIISFGDQYQKEDSLVKIDASKINQAAESALHYLKDDSFREERTHQNFQIAKNELSIQKLEQLLKPIFDHV